MEQNKEQKVQSIKPSTRPHMTSEEVNARLEEIKKMGRIRRFFAIHRLVWKSASTRDRVSAVIDKISYIGSACLVYDICDKATEGHSVVDKAFVGVATLGSSFLLGNAVSKALDDVYGDYIADRIEDRKAVKAVKIATKEDDTNE